MSDYATLIEKYTEKLNRDPSSRVFAPLGEIYRKLAMYDKALIVYENGIKLNPEYNLGLVGLAQCYFDLEQYERSYNVLKPYYKVNTENFKYMHLFASVCEKLNLIDEALEVYKILLFINPKDTVAADFIKSFENRENDPSQIIVESKFEIDDLDEGLEQWSQLSLVEKEEIEREQAEIVINEPGLVETQDQQDIAPEVKSIFSHTLVDLYIKQGAKDRAVEILEKALEVTPDDEKIIERLNELRAELTTSSGHDDLMAAFDNRTKNIQDSFDDDIERVKMAFDLFLLHINKRKESVLNL